MDPPSAYFSSSKPKTLQSEGKRQMQEAFGEYSPAKRLCQHSDRSNSARVESDVKYQSTHQSDSDNDARKESRSP